MMLLWNSLVVPLGTVLVFPHVAGLARNFLPLGTLVRSCMFAFFGSLLFSALLLRGLSWLVRVVLCHSGRVSVVSGILLSA